MTTSRRQLLRTPNHPDIDLAACVELVRDAVGGRERHTGRHRSAAPNGATMPSEVDSYIIKALAEALEPAVVEAVERVTREALARITPEPKRLLSISEAAERLAVSTDTVRRLEKAGQIKPCRLLGSLRFRPEDIEEFVERGGVQ